MADNEKLILDMLYGSYDYMRCAADFEPIEGCETLFDYVLKLQHDSDGKYEICLTLHMKDGSQLTVSNNCWESLLHQDYKGAKMDICDDVDIVIMYVDEGEQYHTVHIPASSVSWIETCARDVKWMPLYRQTTAEEDKRFRDGMTAWKDLYRLCNGKQKS